MFRDRFRTVINVMGDVYGTGVVQHLSQLELDEYDRAVSNSIGGISTLGNRSETKVNEIE